jgi:hypothetical protein
VKDVGLTVVHGSKNRLCLKNRATIREGAQRRGNELGIASSGITIFSAMIVDPLALSMVGTIPIYGSNHFSE